MIPAIWGRRVSEVRFLPGRWMVAVYEPYGLADRAGATTDRHAASWARPTARTGRTLRALALGLTVGEYGGRARRTAAQIP